MPGLPILHTPGPTIWDDNFGCNYVARHRRLKILTLNLHCYQEDPFVERPALKLASGFALAAIIAKAASFVPGKSRSTGVAYGKSTYGGKA